MAIHAFRAMGTSWEIQGPGDHPVWSSACAAIAHRAGVEETRFSRFREDSELTRVNRSMGEPIEVTAPFAELLRLALDAASTTDGLFDPTVVDALVAAGYDRDFDEVLSGARGRLFPATPCGRWRDVTLEGTRVHMPVDVHLDLGGIAKGWTADRAAVEAVALGLRWVVVNAGGDLRVAGEAPPIDVRIEDPQDPSQDLLHVEIAEGAVATSSVTKRTWAPGRHHVIDPRLGTPARTELLQATVRAPTAAEAEILATHALVAGACSAATAPAVLVTRTDEVLVSFPLAVRS